MAKPVSNLEWSHKDEVILIPPLQFFLKWDPFFKVRSRRVNQLHLAQQNKLNSSNKDVINEQGMSKSEV